MVCAAPGSDALQADLKLCYLPKRLLRESPGDGPFKIKRWSLDRRCITDPSRIRAAERGRGRAGSLHSSLGAIVAVSAEPPPPPPRSSGYSWWYTWVGQYTSTLLAARRNLSSPLLHSCAVHSAHFLHRPSSTAPTSSPTAVNGCQQHVTKHVQFSQNQHDPV